MSNHFIAYDIVDLDKRSLAGTSLVLRSCASEAEALWELHRLKKRYPYPFNDPNMHAWCRERAGNLVVLPR